MLKRKQEWNERIITEAFTAESNPAAQPADVSAAQLTSAKKVTLVGLTPLADDAASRVAKSVPGSVRLGSFDLSNMAQEKRQLAYTRFKNADGAHKKP